MRVVTKEYNVYTFDELSKEAQTKALDNARFSGIDSEGFWCEYEVEEIVRELERIGFDNPDISYSGFCSQGDGLSFTCESVDLYELLPHLLSRYDFENEHVKKRLTCLVSHDLAGEFEIARDNLHYSHEHTVYANCKDDGKLLAKEVYQLENGINRYARELMKRFYRQLESIHDYYTSDKYIKESFEGIHDDESRTEFLECGTVFCE